MCLSICANVFASILTKCPSAVSSLPGAGAVLSNIIFFKDHVLHSACLGQVLDSLAFTSCTIDILLAFQIDDNNKEIIKYLWIIQCLSIDIFRLSMHNHRYLWTIHEKSRDVYGLSMIILRYPQICQSRAFHI